MVSNYKIIYTISDQRVTVCQPARGIQIHGDHHSHGGIQGRGGRGCRLHGGDEVVNVQAVIDMEGHKAMDGHDIASEEDGGMGMKTQRERRDDNERRECEKRG